MCELWNEWNQDADIINTLHRIRQLRKDFKETIISNFLTNIDLNIKAANDDLHQRDGKTQQHHAYCTQQIFKMLGGLIRFGDKLLYEPEQSSSSQPIFELCTKYFLTLHHMYQVHSIREMLRFSKYDTIPSVSFSPSVII